MIGYANTTLSIYRGTNDPDEYGDSDDTGNRIATQVPASILEKSRYVATADQDTPMIVRYVAGRMTYGTDIRLGDRLYDERLRCWYSIQSISNPGSPLTRMDIRLELKRVT